MTFASVCSGIEAASVAWIPIGWKCAFTAEIEAFPCAVLKHHYPETPNYGDITKFKDWPVRPIDVLIGGTPCQSFSVAGLRKGLADPRGNLALTFLGVVERFAPAWVVWENVPGVFSSWSDAANRGATEAARNAGETARRLAIEAGFDGDAVGRFGEFEEADQSNDLDCFLAGLRELGYGCALASLDAQYFGLAQRRKRVFVVAHSGGQWQRAAAVLFDRESLCWNPAPSRKTGEGIAPTISSRTKGGGGLGTDAECDGAVIPIQEIGKRQSGTPMNGVGHGQDGDPMFTLQTSAVHGICATLTKNYATHHGRTAGNNGGVAENQLLPVTHSLRADGFDASEDGTGRGTPIIAATLRACSSTEAGHNARAGDKDETLIPEIVPQAMSAKWSKGSSGPAGDECANLIQVRAPIPFDTTQITSKTNRSNPQPGDPSHTLAKGADAPAIAFTQNQEGDVLCGADSAALGTNQNATGRNTAKAQIGMAVRRLTPKECCRLQGFPDDYLDIEYRVKPAADGPKYKALGNSMATPVVRWIGKRIQIVHDLPPREELDQNT